MKRFATSDRFLKDISFEVKQKRNDGIEWLCIRRKYRSSSFAVKKIKCSISKMINDVGVDVLNISNDTGYMGRLFQHRVHEGI